METSIIRHFIGIIILFFAYCLSLSSCNGQPSLKIAPLHPYDEVYRFDSTDCERRLTFFTINCAIEKISDTLLIRSAIDTLLERLTKEQHISYCEYGVWIFKETEELNSKFISDNRKHPELFSKYLVVKAQWIDGEFLGYSFYKNGQVLNNSDELKLIPLNNEIRH
ncbi:MAG: hypothetical protein MUE72_09070 [Chitinophagaceae bacterium]|jgi:hypothetical protein|nr:hypothetical protein [Chitinophagaceae bacterium]MCU0383647.1 hypothetical protein [Cyclobacteriaceae bacterium]